MTSFRAQLPENFNFSHPEDWPKWSRRFERFRQASGLVKEEEESQINTLICTMGDKADDILNSFKLSTAQLKQYHTVKTKFDENFVLRRNVIFERAKFNRRRQEKGETVDSFVIALHTLAEHCALGTLQDELIRDRIVVGLLDSKLAEKLQLDPELTLTKAMHQARQSEAMKRQQTLMKNDFKEPAEVDAVNFKKPPKSKDFKNQVKDSPAVRRCEYCGKTPGHIRQNCPAKETTCHKCSKRGHWGIVCKSLKTVGSVEEEDYAFLGAVGTEAGENIWSVKLSLNNSPVSFKIDTGGDVTIIPESIYNSLNPSPTLIKSSKTLFGPADTALPTHGYFMGKITHGEKATDQEIFVVTGARQALLGRPAIESLQLVEKINAIEVNKEYKAQFPKLFTGLGKLDGPDYVIKLKPDAKPFALTTPRRVPVPLLSKVKEELARMEQMQIISKVDEPTEWCAGMVVVPKANDKVRICVDLTRLNENILREFHPLPLLTRH